MYITKEEFEKLSYETLDNVLARLHNKTIEDTLRLLPDIIIGLTVKTKGISDGYKAFMDLHPEFKGKEEEMMKVIETIELEDGTQDLSEILKKVPAAMGKIEIPKDQPSTLADLERTCNGFL